MPLIRYRMTETQHLIKMSGLKYFDDPIGGSVWRLLDVCINSISYYLSSLQTRWIQLKTSISRWRRIFSSYLFTGMDGHIDQPQSS